MKSLQVNPALKTDFYKQGHRQQYPDGTELVFTNLTARGSRVKGLNEVIHFGTQASIQMLVEDFEDNFFSKTKADVVASFKHRLNTSLGIDADSSHIEDLHDLGHLPLTFWALPEGERVPLRVPMVVFWNTDKRFFWLTNFIETEFSANTWGFITSATTADLYREKLERWAKLTNPEALEFVPWQGHDFSYRGMFGGQAAMMSGMAHLTSFTGTDTIPAIDGLEHYYDADADKELIGGSVWATEHSVMCMGGADDELGTFRRIIEDVYPSGIVSIVSDTWNLWDVVGGPDSIVSRLKGVIEGRDGKVVIRPDSGDPVKIICGDSASEDKHIRKGVVECLWDIFGGSESSSGYKVLSEKIGAIYGDSITLERAEHIAQRLAQKGFASTNVVLGIGSFTYQGAITQDCIVTRDSHGMAVKSTYGEINGEPKAIFKDPITDDGLKKSLKGLISVHDTEGGFVSRDESSWCDVENCAFNEIWTNGSFVTRSSLSDVRKKIRG
jgi:nicotinamide phosphoribosyltransferase